MNTRESPEFDIPNVLILDDSAFERASAPYKLHAFGVPFVKLNTFRQPKRQQMMKSLISRFSTMTCRDGTRHHVIRMLHRILNSPR